MLRLLTKLPSHVSKILLPTHVLGILALVLLPQVGWSFLWLTLLGWILVSGVGMAVGYHRYFSHKAFATSRFGEYLMAFCGIFGAQGSAIFWAAMHKGYHHPYSDTTRDLHSPVNGLWSSYMGWMFKLTPSSVNLKYAIDLLRDPLHLFIHKHYVKIFWGVVIVVAIMNWRVALYLILLPALIAQHTENLVDLFCHVNSWGSYRNHNTRDQSVNHPLLGWFGWGQGWHNNHHARPADYDFGGERWFEFDPSCLIVGLLKRWE